MPSKSRRAHGDVLGLRHDADDTDHSGRRQSARKRTRKPRLATVLTTAMLAFPHHAKAETPKRSRRAPVPVVTTRVETAIAVPPQRLYDALIREAAARHGVDAMLIRSVVQAESAFNAVAVSRAGAQGLMQLMPRLSKELGVEDPFDARQNVMAGALYLRRLLDRYRGNVRLALAAYNAGMTTVEQYGGVPPWRETQNYVRRVTALVDQSRGEALE